MLRFLQMHRTGYHQAICQRLLKRENAAWRAYGEIIRHFESSPYEDLIRLIQQGHQKNMEILVKQIIRDGGNPKLKTDFRGNLAIHLANAGELLGDGPVIAALKLAESDCLREYERTLNMLESNDPLRDNIALSLTPRIENHLATLDLIVS